MTGHGRLYVIAEAGVNHNGDLGMALDLVDAAAAAGADAVKFQAFHADDVATARAPKAAYQERATGGQGSQRDMLRSLELDREGQRQLLGRCAAKGIDFLSSPFDLDSLRFLTGELGVSTIKIPSGEITNAPLLLEAALGGVDIICSTGMSTLEEVEEALAVLAFGYAQGDGEPSREAFRRAYGSDAGREALQRRVVLLHCTSDYPTPHGDVNLKAMDTLSGTFGLAVGLSDHSLGYAIAAAAAARGATVIEKHFTLDRSLPGPDHQASLEPGELAAMVVAVRQVEAALGDGIKEPTRAERHNMAVARKSLVALRPIARGEAFSEENLGCKRPGDGLSPMHYWDRLGDAAERDYAKDEPIGS